MQERRADEVLVLDGEAIWSRAIQETFNRLDKAVGSLLDGSRPSCFPIENQQLAQWLLPHRGPARDRSCRKSRWPDESACRSARNKIKSVIATVFS